MRRTLDRTFKSWLFVLFPLTGVVPAAAGSAASPPHPVELHGVPVAEAVITQSIGRQVTDLQPRKLPQEIIEGHPGDVEAKSDGNHSQNVCFF